MYFQSFPYLFLSSRDENKYYFFILKNKKNTYKIVYSCKQHENFYIYFSKYKNFSDKINYNVNDKNKKYMKLYVIRTEKETGHK